MAGKIIYHRKYNISIYGLERFHKFPTDKYYKIAKKLRSSCLAESFVAPRLDEEMTLSHMSEEYRSRCHTPKWLAECLEVPVARYAPSWFMKKHLCMPMIWASCGTVQAALCAMEHGKSVNLSGGYHHASFIDGEGFCIYPDVPIALKEMRKRGKCRRIVILDLDAHQGNGIGRCFLEDDPDLLLVDAYDKDIWPGDTVAKEAIDVNIELGAVDDQEYFRLLREIAFPAMLEFKPELILYNAGTDIYEKDPLTNTMISFEGVIERDKMVFGFGEKHSIPVAMVLSGGYHYDSAEIIAQSIIANFSEK